MKRIAIIVIVALVLAAGLSAQAVTEDKDVKTLSVDVEGRAKAGLLAGMPSGLTIGYRLSNWFEVNATAGYNFIIEDAVVLSANGLFTLVNIPAGEIGVLPLSVGPQVNFLFNDGVSIQLVGDVRVEYTFEDIPLNLFVEGGFGFEFNDPNDEWIAWNGGIGARYVF